MSLLEIGRVVRPHGLRGEVVVVLVTNRLERLAPGSELVLGDGTGVASRPLVVESSRPHSRRHLVRFLGVQGIDAAEALRDGVLFASPVEDVGAFFAHDLIGKTVRDRAGTVRGTITALQDNPASDLLVLDDGHLVPVRFILETSGTEVLVDVPEGLFE